MTAPRPLPETFSQARDRLAKDLGVEPEELDYAGKMMGPDYKLLLFTVHKFGNPLNHTTRSVKVPYDDAKFEKVVKP